MNVMRTMEFTPFDIKTPSHNTKFTFGYIAQLNHLKTECIQPFNVMYFHHHINNRFRPETENRCTPNMMDSYHLWTENGSKICSFLLKERRPLRVVWNNLNLSKHANHFLCQTWLDE